MAINSVFNGNLNFGDSIVDERKQKRQIQADMEKAAMQAAIQARGQSLQRDAADANRAEGARQFDARMAESAAARADAAAQREAELAERGAAREEGARQFDARMDEVERQRLDERGDKLHRQSWDDALNEQRLAGLQQEFDKRNVELERIMAIRQKEDEERAHQQELVESAYGDAVIAAELGGGFLSPGQIEDFNKRNNTDYNYVGKVDPTTGKPFEDGKLHFLTYQLDENGQVVMDEQSGRPMLTTDNPISAEFYGRVMDGYFGKFKGLMGRGSGESGTRPTTGTPSARDMNAIAGTIERIGGMSPDMFEGGASEQKAFIKHLMQQTGFQFDGSVGGGGGGGLAVQPKNGSGAATVETGDETGKNTGSAEADAIRAELARRAAMRGGRKPASAAPAPAESKQTQTVNETSHGLAKELGIDQAFVDRLAAEDDEFDADDVSDDFKHNWLGNADSAITKLYNYARIEGRKDVMSAIDKYVADNRAKRKQAEIDSRNKSLSRREEVNRLTLKQSIDEMKREVRREAISKGKDADWIKSEIENRQRDVERRHRTTNAIRYDINGNPIM